MDQLFAGATAACFAAAGLFFLRFWRETRDPLFGLFSLALFALAGNRVFLALAAGSDRPYWVRLLAFALILAAVADKNRGRPPRT